MKSLNFVFPCSTLNAEFVLDISVEFQFTRMMAGLFRGSSGHDINEGNNCKSSSGLEGHKSDMRVLRSASLTG